MALTKPYSFRAGGGFKQTRGCSSLPVARKHAQKLVRRLGQPVSYGFLGGARHTVKRPKANPCSANSASFSVYDKATGGRRLFTRKTFGAALTAAQSNADGTGKRRWVRGAGKKQLVKPGGLVRNAPKGAGVKKGKKLGDLTGARAEARAAQKLATRLGKPVTYGFVTARPAKNPAPAGYSKAWYQRGFRAGVQGKNRDQYTAWHGQKGKPKTSGARVTAQESFYKGFYDGQERRPQKKNPAVLGDWVGVQGAKAVRVRRVKGATLLDIKS